MNVGVSIPLPAYLVDPAFMARTAEDLGFESFLCAPLEPWVLRRERAWTEETACAQTFRADPASGAKE
jgi:hypothetical protein